MNRLVDCAACGGLRHANESACPHCDRLPEPPGTRARVLAIGVGVGASLLMSCVVFHYGPAPLPECEEPLPDGGTELQQCSSFEDCPCLHPDGGVGDGGADAGQDDGGAPDA